MVLTIPAPPVSCRWKFLTPFQASGSPGGVSGAPAGFSGLTEEFHTGKLLCFEESSHTPQASSVKEPKQRQSETPARGDKATTLVKIEQSCSRL